MVDDDQQIHRKTQIYTNRKTHFLTKCVFHITVGGNDDETRVGNTHKHTWTKKYIIDECNASELVVRPGGVEREEVKYRENPRRLT